MSRIVVSLRLVEARPEVIRFLREVTGQGFGELRDALQEGAPLLDVNLFGNDHEEVAGKLRRLLRSPLIAQPGLRILEVVSVGGRQFETPTTPDVLENILLGAERTITEMESEGHDE